MQKMQLHTLEKLHAICKSHLYQFIDQYES